MQNGKVLYKDTGEHVKKLFIDHKDENLLFHNLEHTQEVVERTAEIAKYYKLGERDMYILGVAAWFHDVGHLFIEPPHHEEKSVELMKEFLETHSGNPDLINEISECIMATKFPRNPKSLLAQILCDADTYHLGTKEFKSMNDRLKSELELRNPSNLVEDWDNNTLKFLESHTFYTSYCKELLDQGKEKNVRKLRKKTTKDRAINSNHNKLILSEAVQGDFKGKGDRNNLVSKGIQTMLRLTSSHHLDLSRMADSKANILISVNSIIISVILSVLVRKIEVERYLTIPTIIFLTSSLATIIIAILSTRPNITKGSFTRQEILNKETNLLFFGNFHTASLEEYTWGMGTMMRDPDYLYSALVKDIYYLGVVLAKKYRLIRIAYNVFMIGIIVSVISFLIAALVYTGNPQVVVNNNPGPTPF